MLQRLIAYKWVVVGLAIVLIALGVGAQTGLLSSNIGDMAATDTRSAITAKVTPTSTPTSTPTNMPTSMPTSTPTSTPTNMPVLSINNASGFEGGPLTFTLTLSAPSASPVSVSFITSDGTATGADYISASGTVTFYPGYTSMPITIQIKSDYNPPFNLSLEPDETMYVQLFNVVNATIAQGGGIGTIHNCSC